MKKAVRRYGGTAVRLAERGAAIAALTAALLTALPPYRLTAQSIAVVANRAFRPTAVLLPHFQYTLATDSTDGALVLRDVTINPVTFAGLLRIEGVEPLAREAEPRPFPDSARFEADGRIALSLANGAGRPPMSVEVHGSRLGTGARVVVTAPDWPLSRVLLVTIAPADIAEHRWRSVGYGSRDRVRIDDRNGMAFLSDSTTGPTTVAIAIGGGARGRIQSDVATVTVERRYGQDVAREPRQVAALSLIVQPARDESGRARAEILFGLGDDEIEAAQHALAAQGEAAPAPSPPPLRVTTPSPDVSWLLAHILGAARPMLDYDRIAGLRNMPAGSYTYLAAFDRDGWYGAMTALQLGDAAVVCSEYALMKRYADPSLAQRHEIWNRLGARGRYVWTDEWGGRWMGDKDLYQILKGYACYRATREATWLRSELPTLQRIAAFVRATDHDGDGLLEGASDATYSEMSPLAPDSTYRTEDPYVNALAAYALDRLAELDDEAARRALASAGDAEANRAAAARIRAALPTLWRPEKGWFAYHALANGSRSWDHYHLQPVDALVFGGVADTAIQRRMVAQLLGSSWWDQSARGFYAVPIDDDWHDLASYWRGHGWHILDFKALHAAFAYGVPGQRAIAWERLVAEAGRILRVNYGRPGERSDNNGLFMFSAGAYLDLLGRGLFGIEEHLDGIEIAPHVDGIADDQMWRLDGWILGNDTLSLAYRPRDRALTVGLGALQRRRLLFRVPWLSPAACVTVRRGPDTERLTPVFLADGSAYLDIRGAFDPAFVTLSARGCGD
jgi:hypothetical protein